MRGHYHWIVLMLLSAVLAIPAVVARPRSASPVEGPADARPPAGQNWLAVGGDWDGERYSALTQINAQTVKDLGGAWVSKTFEDGASSRVTPLVKDGLMFTTAGVHVYALDGKTGERVWDFKTSTINESRTGLALLGVGAPNSQGMGVGEGMLFVGLMDGHGIALDEKTGKLIWTIDLRDQPPKTVESISAAPVYASGTVFWGLSTNERYIGRAIATDAKTGHELWHFLTIPGPGEKGHETWPSDSNTWTRGSGSVWEYPVVDPDLGLVYYGTGNADPVFAGEVRAGNNLYTSSIVALDMKTGKLRWYYQISHHDLWETDITTPPVLYNTEMGGRERKGIGVMRSTDGHLFMIDRETGKPLIPVEERPVPQDAFNKTSPTQPFPVSPSILRDCSEWNGKIPAGFVLGCAFTPLKVDLPNMMMTGPEVRYEPMSYSQQTGYFYVQGKDDVVWFRRGTDPYTHMLFYRAPGQDKYAYSVLAAIDSRTGKIAWRKTTALTPGYGTGGWLSTGGGLAFHRMLDGTLAGFDAKTGDILWQFQTGHPSGDASPVSYEVDGQQYVAVSEGTAIWAFKLGGTVAQAAPAKLPPPQGDFAGPLVDGDRVETTALKSTDIYETGKRYYVDATAFNPYRLRVKAGTPVIFANNGDENHTIVALDGSWSTGTLEPTQTATITFDKPGEYAYRCKEHPWSFGQIVVVDAANAGPAGPAGRGGFDGGGPGAAQGGSAGGFASQADRGKVAYQQSCSACHMANLSGNGEAAPALTGNDFFFRWTGRTSAELFDKTRTTMPTGAAGTLSRQTYLDIVSYILQVNEIPAGNQELKEEALKGLPLTK